MNNTNQLIFEYSEKNGAITLWDSWKRSMQDQSREVRKELLEWPIPQLDQELDAKISFDVVEDFLVWAEVHKGMKLVVTK